jgi:hypothetical protein
MAGPGQEQGPPHPFGPQRQAEDGAKPAFLDREECAAGEESRLRAIAAGSLRRSRFLPGQASEETASGAGQLNRETRFKARHRTENIPLIFCDHRDGLRFNWALVDYR